MGNYASCALARITPTPSTNSSAAKVIFPGGEIRQFKSPITAAELMLESPNSFVVTYQSLRVGRRFSPLPADEDLDVTSGVYVILPMNRLNSCVTASDMTYMAVNGNNKKKKHMMRSRSWSDGSSCSVGKVSSSMLSERNILSSSSLLNLDEIQGLCEFKHRMSVSRSNKPVLDTIFEEPLSLEGRRKDG